MKTRSTKWVPLHVHKMHVRFRPQDWFVILKLFLFSTKTLIVLQFILISVKTDEDKNPSTYQSSKNKVKVVALPFKMLNYLGTYIRNKKLVSKTLLLHDNHVDENPSVCNSR